MPLEVSHDLSDPIYYVTGTPSMVVGTLGSLRDLNIPDSNIEIEAFARYQWPSRRIGSPSL